jgi:uncharacterized protein YkwD
MLKSVSGLLAVLALLVPTIASASDATASRQETAVLRELNRVRAQRGLAVLRLDGHLQRAAHAHTREMLATNEFSHGSFAARMLRFDVQGRVAGENLAWGVGSGGTAAGIVAAWLASPEHRANLLGGSYRRIGVGDLAGAVLGHGNARVVTADFAG